MGDFPDPSTLDVAGFFAMCLMRHTRFKKKQLLLQSRWVVMVLSGNYEFLLEAQGFDALKLYQMESM